MAIAVPQRIFDYKINASAPTDELLTLGRLLAEIGGYASTVSGRDYALTAGKCQSKLQKIETELLRRKAIRHPDDIFVMPEQETETVALDTMDIDALERLYRRRPHRINLRLADGREHFTLFFEKHIVNELRRRKARTAGEQLKKDYCLISFEIESENMASILHLPRKCGESESIDIASADLYALIERLENPQTLEERETLVEAIDIAIDRINASTKLQPLGNLIAAIAEIDRRGIVKAPSDIKDLLAAVIKQWQHHPETADTDMVLPLLTQALIAGDASLERRATRIIRRSHRACLAGTPTPADLTTARVYASYLRR